MSKMGWIHALEAIGPMVVKVAFPQFGGAADAIVGATKAAEAIPGATGEQKAQIAQQIAIYGATATNNITGKPLVDPAVAQTITGDVFTAVVQATNAAHAAATSAQAAIPAA